MAAEHTKRPTRTNASGNGFDLALAITFIAAGAVAITISDRQVGMLNPDLVGSATAGVLSVVLAKAARLPYRGMIATVLGIVLIQLIASIAAGIPPAALIGYPLVALGFVGLPEIMASRRASREHRENPLQHTSRKPLPGAKPTQNALGHGLVAG